MRGRGRKLTAIVVCVLVLFSVQARFPLLDAITLRLPHPVRSVVATLAVYENNQEPAALTRALRLDPDNAAAWGRRCTAYVGNNSAERLEDCRRAVALRASATNLRGEASALEEDGDFCAAERAYRDSLGETEFSGQRPYVMRDMALSALSCGHVQASLETLQAAEEMDSRNGSDGVAADRSYLSVVYEAMNDRGRARQMCSEANPGYGGCSCELTSTGVSCKPDVLPHGDVVARK